MPSTWVQLLNRCQTRCCSSSSLAGAWSSQCVLSCFGLWCNLLCAQAAVVLQVGAAGDSQYLKVIDKQPSGKVVVRDHLPVAYVPLVRSRQQSEL